MLQGLDVPVVVVAIASAVADVVVVVVVASAVVDVVVLRCCSASLSV